MCLGLFGFLFGFFLHRRHGQYHLQIMQMQIRFVVVELMGNSDISKL